MTLAWELDAQINAEQAGQDALAQGKTREEAIEVAREAYRRAVEAEELRRAGVR